nr:hypothetical protein Itr_chr03CG25890 [Ipomoea trifida]
MTVDLGSFTAGAISTVSFRAVPAIKLAFRSLGLAFDLAAATTTGAETTILCGFDSAKHLDTPEKELFCREETKKRKLQKNRTFFPKNNFF